MTESVHVTPDLKLIDVDVADYSGFILPCMHAGASSETVDPQAIRIVKEAILAKKPVAVQHAAIIILAKAGLLKGINYAWSMSVYRRALRTERRDQAINRVFNCGNYW